MSRLRGSFTVEAAFLIPVIILLTAFFLNTAIALYGTVDRAAGDGEEVKKLDSVELFLDAVRLREGREKEAANEN